MNALAKVPVSMSLDEFLAWNPGGDEIWQLVDAVPQAMAPPSTIHGALQSELARLIGNHLWSQGGRCRILTTPGVVPHVLSSANLRVPDLAVTCSPLEIGQSSITDSILVIEILSPSNQAETRANLWAYSTIPSVQEIFVLQSVSIGAELMRRGSDGTWPKEPERIKSADIVLDSIGMRLPLLDLYDGTPLWRPSAG
jgi:Uma2 family endonuclease